MPIAKKGSELDSEEGVNEEVKLQRSTFHQLDALGPKGRPMKDKRIVRLSAKVEYCLVRDGEVEA